jgi:hypothetical protein
MRDQWSKQATNRTERGVARHSREDHILGTIIGLENGRKGELS